MHAPRVCQIVGASFVILGLTHVSFAAVTASGSYWPVPLHAGDGVVTSQLQLGLALNTTGVVTVTDSDTLTTEQSTVLGYTVASRGEIHVTDANWIAESAIFAGHTFAATALIHVDGGTVDVQSNVELAQGDHSSATLTLVNGSSWTSRFGLDLADCDDCTAEVHITESSLTSQSGIRIGGTGFSGSTGDGSIHINTGGLLVIGYALEITPYGAVHLDGGTLQVTGDNPFEGTFDVTPLGGTVRLLVGASAGGNGSISLGNDVDLTHANLELLFRDDFNLEPVVDYPVFSAIGGVNLAATLAQADAISTPPGWALDFNTGLLGFMSFADCLTGPVGSAPPACQDALDHDADEDVDLSDFARYQRLVVSP
jgi:hypothetical protein